MSSIKKQLETLVALQKAEIEIGRIEKDLAGIDGRIEDLDKEIRIFEDRLGEHQEALTALKQQYRSDENEIKIIDAQIAKSNEKLRAVKTNKEYQSILKEIDELKHKSSTMEDRMIEHLERIEAAESELLIHKADLADVTAEVAVKQEEIRGTANEHRQVLVDLQNQRGGIWETVNPKIQTLYAKVKQQGGGVALAGVADAVCQVCRMNIPPQLYNELLRLDIMRMCPNCQRIIYPQVMLDESE